MSSAFLCAFAFARSRRLCLGRFYSAPCLNLPSICKFRSLFPALLNFLTRLVIHVYPGFLIAPILFTVFCNYSVGGGYCADHYLQCFLITPSLPLIAPRVRRLGGQFLSYMRRFHLAPSAIVCMDAYTIVRFPRKRGFRM